MISSRSASGRPNWRRLAAWRVAAARQTLASPGAPGPERRPAEIEHRQRDLQPLAERSQDIRCRHPHVVKCQPRRGRAPDAALGHPRLDDLEARQVGRDQKRGDFRVAPRGSGVRAMTVKTSAIAPLVM